jgi:SulP family sulfate permease
MSRQADAAIRQAIRTAATRAASLAATGAGALPDAMIAALVTLTYALSHAALIFGPAPPDTQARGLFMVLVSVLVLAAAGVILIRPAHLFVTTESTPLAVLAGGTASLAAALSNSSPAVTGATIIAGVTITSLLAGLAMTLLGQFRGGTLTRFVPLQVTAGLTGATGASLIIGGCGIALGRPPGLAAAADATAWLHLGPALFGAAALVAGTRLIGGRAPLPALLLIGAGLHHAVFAMLGISVTVQQQGNWLLRAPGHLRPELPWTAETLSVVDWTVLQQHLSTAIAVVAVVCLSTLMTFRSVELATRQETDIDPDLRAVGIASIASAMCGGLLGSVSQSRSVLLFSQGKGNRAATLLCGGVAGLLPLLWPEGIGFVPRGILASLLIYVGFGLLDTWTFRIRSRLTRLEWLTVPTVIGVALYFGLPAAVFAGMALGCATFAVTYSQGAPVRVGYRGDVARSHVVRSAAEEAILADRAGAVLVMYAQGFMFFGTASRLIDRIRLELEAPGGDEIRFVVLDCSGIDGMDGSALASFERLLHIVAASNVSLILAAMPEPVQERLARNLRPPPRFEDTLDHALEACETVLLSGHEAEAAAEARFSMADEFDDSGDLEAFVAELTVLEVAQDTVLMQQGEMSNDLMFIESGQANIVVLAPNGEPLRLRQYGPGTMLGEIGFLQGTARTATVVAATPCRMLVLTRDALPRLQAKRPSAVVAFQRALITRLTKRLTDKDRTIQALLRNAR